MRAQRSPIQRDLCRLAAAYHLGALVNAIDEIGKRYVDADVLPSSAYKAATALWSMLADLDLTDAGRSTVADVWRAP